MKIAIVYFSGTGNTAVTANWLKEELEKLGNSVSLLKMTDILSGKQNFVPADYDLLGFGCPAYAFSMAEIIDSLLLKLPDGKCQKVFLFVTAADYGMVNHGSMKLVRKILTKKNYQVFHEKIYCMPGNMVTKTPDELEKQLFRALLKTQTPIIS